MHREAGDRPLRGFLLLSCSKTLVSNGPQLRLSGSASNALPLARSCIYEIKNLHLTCRIQAADWLQG
jgi:hypothetical protein